MSLQDIFYVFGIIFMASLIIVSIVLIVLLITIKQRITTLITSLETSVGLAKHVLSNPRETAEAVGNALVGTAINKATKFLTGRKKA